MKYFVSLPSPLGGWVGNEVLRFAAPFSGCVGGKWSVVYRCSWSQMAAFFLNLKPVVRSECPITFYFAQSRHRRPLSGKLSSGEYGKFRVVWSKQNRLRICGKYFNVFWEYAERIPPYMEKTQRNSYVFSYAKRHKTEYIFVTNGPKTIFFKSLLSVGLIKPKNHFPLSSIRNVLSNIQVRRRKTFPNNKSLF
jgi:hypothetical protein